MKKILAVVSLLITIAACTAPTETSNSAATSNANSGTATRPAASPLTEADAIAKEKAAWDAIKSKDYQAFAALLASDQIYVSGSGVYDKERTVSDVKGFEPTDVTFSDWKYLPVDKDAVILIYTVAVKGKMNGKDIPPDKVRSSSAWVDRDGKWVSVYHQECPVLPPPKTTAQASKPAPATSPASSPAAVITGPDAVANEKAIWDALKSKNFDAFASALAPEAIEVEPDGVFDKAGSVRNVSQFDFSKATLSDFKTLKFDDDAILVTYKAKLPSMGGNAEYHSTLWANRSGKWLAMFHHGAPAMPATPAASPAKAGASPTAKAPATK